MAWRSLAGAVRDALLPKGAKVRRLRFGIARGARMRIDFQRQSAVYFGVYETELNEHFRRLVRPGFRCFDVGGNIGYDAIVMASLSGAPVITFECDANNVPILEENVRANAFDVRIVHAYVSRPDDAGGLTLDEAARQHFTPDFIKMDIEGAETDALLGASEILSKRRPGLIVELHGRDREADCLRIVREHGYSAPLLVDPRPRWFKEYKGDGHVRWLVCDGAEAKQGAGAAAARSPAGRTATAGAT